MDEIKYTFDGKFETNILIVGRTGCGKTTFVQSLGKNELFGDISTVIWISKISLSQEREDAIKDSFNNQEVYFNYPENVEDFNYLIEDFMQRKANYVSSELREEIFLDKLIVMDDVSGLADKSDIFSNFLTVSRKYGLSCVYIFHTIYPKRQNCKMIMSQTHVFNFFSRSVHSGTIQKTLSLFASKYKNSYLPTCNIWLIKLYFDISTSKQKQCLTVDTGDINDLGPGKLRAQTNNGLRQICYYNRNKSDTSFNSFLATRKQISQEGVIKFSIDKVIKNLNNSGVSYLDLGDELKNIDNDNFQSKLQQLGRGNITSRKQGNKNRDRDGQQQ